MYRSRQEILEHMEEHPHLYSSFWYWWFYRQVYPLPKETCFIIYLYIPGFLYLIKIIKILLSGVMIYHYKDYDDPIHCEPITLPEIPFSYRAERSPLFA